MYVTDVAQLDPMPVASIKQPVTTEGVADAVRNWPGAISVGGGRFSMGGQIASAESLHVDMRAMDQLVTIDVPARIARCQAGMRWRDLLDHLDPDDLSISIMQSYANFTIGGSVSVNCHGRYVGQGAMARSIRALQLVTAEGQVMELGRAHDAELFAAVIGGYGGLGIVTEVELDLTQNSAMVRKIERVSLEEYPTYFTQQVVGDPEVLMHNADLMPPNFDQPLAVSWRRTTTKPTVAERLMPRNVAYHNEQNLIWAASELPGAHRLRSFRDEAERRAPPTVVWRNFEASRDTAALEPRTRAMSTYLLQEYFVPVAQFEVFVRRMADILQRADANVLNVSIRHAPTDTLSLLRWATEPVFCFVLYFKQRNSRAASRRSDAWTRDLIDLALELGGRYYLPYRLAATREQFWRAYPEVAKYREIKRAIDPRLRFRNHLIDKYVLD